MSTPTASPCTFRREADRPQRIGSFVRNTFSYWSALPTIAFGQALHDHWGVLSAAVNSLRLGQNRCK